MTYAFRSLHWYQFSIDSTNVGYVYLVSYQFAVVCLLLYLCIYLLIAVSYVLFCCCRVCLVFATCPPLFRILLLVDKHSDKS
jgi:hypothetical protein